MQEHKLQQAKLQDRRTSSNASVIPPFEETLRDFAVVAPRGRLRLGRHPNSSADASRKGEQQQTILHRDGTAVVAIDPHELLDHVRCTSGERGPPQMGEGRLRRSFSLCERSLTLLFWVTLPMVRMRIPTPVLVHIAASELFTVSSWQPDLAFSKIHTPGWPPPPQRPHGGGYVSFS